MNKYSIIYKFKIIQDLIDPTTDIDLIIKNSSFIICVPFTSPLILANYLNKNSIYYDPTDSIIPYEGQGNFLIKGKKSLYKKLLKINKSDIS
jgi:polysaccharide biosynthesis PFTS motif protein